MTVFAQLCYYENHAPNCGISSNFDVSSPTIFATKFVLLIIEQYEFKALNSLRPSHYALCRDNRDLKQARTATAVNKQLHFRVKKKPQTTDYVYVLHNLKHILCLKVCERTVLTVLKSILSNTLDRGEGCRRPEDVKKLGFSRLQHDGNLLGVGKRYSRMTSKQSIQFFHTLLIIKYASNMQYI